MQSKAGRLKDRQTHPVTLISDYEMYVRMWGYSLKKLARTQETFLVEPKIVERSLPWQNLV